jgi:hypothetical protein
MKICDILGDFSRSRASPDLSILEYTHGLGYFWFIFYWAPYIYTVEFLGEIINSHMPEKLFTLEYQNFQCRILREKYIQILFPGNGTILDVIPQNVPYCQWNDGEAPLEIRIRVILKSMLVVIKIMKKCG